MRRRELSEEDLDSVAQMLIPRLDALTADEYKAGHEATCWLPGCDRVGYARGMCQPHHKRAAAMRELREGTP